MAIPYPEKKPLLKVGQAVTVEWVPTSPGGPKAEPGKVVRKIRTSYLVQLTNGRIIRFGVDWRSRAGNVQIKPKESG
jgi:hypothetical protein